MATTDKDSKAIPVSGRHPTGLATAMAGDLGPGDASRTSEVAGLRSAGINCVQADSAPEINLVLANPARVRVTRKAQSPSPSADQGAASAVRSSRGVLRATRAGDEMEFESFQLGDFKRLDPPASSGDAGDPAIAQGSDAQRMAREEGPDAAPDATPDAAPDMGCQAAGTREVDGDPNALVSKSVATNQLHSSRLQSRVPYDEKAIRSFAASIRTNGWQQPILVRPHPVIADNYEIVVGELPYRAALFAGLEDLPVVVCGLSDFRALECVLLEDVQRPDLAPLEVAVGYGQLIRTFDYSLADLAKLVGKSERQVGRLLLLLDPVKALGEKPERGDAGPDRLRPPSHAPGAADLAAKALTGGATSRTSPENAVRSQSAGRGGARDSRTLNAEVAALERHLSDVLGLKVEMTTKGRQGAVQISFAGIEQLERIARHLSLFGAHAEVAQKYPGLAA